MKLELGHQCNNATFVAGYANKTIGFYPIESLQHESFDVGKTISSTNVGRRSIQHSIRNSRFEHRTHPFNFYKLVRKNIATRFSDNMIFVKLETVRRNKRKTAVYGSMCNLGPLYSLGHLVSAGQGRLGFDLNYLAVCFYEDEVGSGSQIDNMKKYN